MDLAVLGLIRGDEGWFARILCCLANSWNLICARIPSKMHFGLSLPVGLRTFALQRNANKL